MTKGRLKGKLVAAVFGRGRFATASGIVLGMTRAQALQRDPGLIAARFCGQTVLRDSPLLANRAHRWAGLNIGLSHGKVRGFDIFSSHVKVTCAKHGGFDIWT